ncbi:uncharacterized protein [Asterias amurensis]|uniref:uncharacterized protein n=1 Tax=Asterias amurensis TaxID=7602 RepID=UPI003AB7EBC1
MCSENGFYSELIFDAMISASSAVDGYPATAARLGYEPPGWIPKPLDKFPWIEVSFSEPVWLARLTTQAPSSLSMNNTIMEFNLLLRPDENGHWIKHQMIFQANYFTNNSVQDFDFDRSLLAQEMRLYIRTGGSVGLRLEVFGCRAPTNTECFMNSDCNRDASYDHGQCACVEDISTILSPTPSISCQECWVPLGLESKVIKDFQISSSSERPSTGDQTGVRLGGDDAWSPADNDPAPWIKVTFIHSMRVMGMSTEGQILYLFDKDFAQDATVEYGNNTTNHSYHIEEGGQIKVFELNTDSTEVVTHIFPYSIVTDYITLHILSPPANKIGLGLELYGCSVHNQEESCCGNVGCHHPVRECVRRKCVNTTTNSTSTPVASTSTGQPTTTSQPTTTNQPTTSQPTTSQPTTSQPTTTGQPTTSQPTTSQPTTTQPTTTSQPTTASQPTTSQPTTSQPTTTQQTTTQPTTTSQPTTTQSTTTHQPSTVAQSVCPQVKSLSTSPQSIAPDVIPPSSMYSEPPGTFLQEIASGLSEEEIAELCSALAGGSGANVSRHVTHVGLHVLQEATANTNTPIPPSNLATSVKFLEAVSKMNLDGVDFNSSKHSLEQMANIGSSLMNPVHSQSWSDAKSSDALSGPFQVIQSLEEMAFKVGQNLGKDASVEIVTDNIGINLFDMAVDELLISGWNWSSSDSMFTASITAQEFRTKNLPAQTRALLVGGVFKNVAALSPGEVANKDIKNATNGTHLKLQSDVVTVLASTSGKISMAVSFSTPKNTTLVDLKANEKPSFTCVFWDYDESDQLSGSGKWSDYGCYLVEEGDDAEDIFCYCNHTTNFAVLMQVTESTVPEDEIHTTILMVLTFACSGISIVSLLIALTVFLFLGSSMASERLTIHTNMMAALLMAMILFLLGVASELTVIPCKIVAVVLHYLFLATFCWILVEGIHLYKQVISVFDQGKSKMPFYYLIGWGVPAVIVGIAFGFKSKLYGSGDHCWLTQKDGLIWAFVGPLIVIVTVNMVVLIMVVVVVTRAAALKCQTNFERIRAACKSAMMLVPLLGISWIIGLFIQYSIVLRYAFIILNALQGFFMFIFYCVMSSEVRTAFRHELKKRADRSMDGSRSVAPRTNAWTITDKKTHVRLMKVSPSSPNSDSAY